MKKEILLRKNEITQWIKEKKPKNFICKELNCKPSTLDSWLKKMNIEYKGKQNWAKGKKFPEKWIIKVEDNSVLIIHQTRIRKIEGIY